MKILYYVPLKKDKIKNWEFYKADSDALKNNFNTKIVYNFKDFLIELPSASIVYTHWWARSIIAIILSRIFKKKVICTGAIHFFDKSGEPTWFKMGFILRLMNLISLNLANINIAVSNHQKKQFHKYLKIKNIKIMKLKINKKINDKVSKIQVKKKPDKKKILNITTILWHTNSSYKRKGLYESLDAIEILKEKKINFIFNIIGANGDGLENLKDIINRRKLNDYVNILTGISFIKKIKILKSTHVYLQPSYCESFGYAVLEASYCRVLSIISKKNSALEEIVKKNGFYVKKISGKGIFKQIIKYLKLSSKQEKKIISSLFNHINENYSFKLHNVEIKKLINTLIV